MSDDRLEAILALNPKSEGFREELTTLFEGYSLDAIASHCIDRLEHNLAILCVLFYQVRGPTPGTVKSIAENDLLTTVIIFSLVLRETWKHPETASNDQRACLETVTNLLECIEPKGEQPRSTVKDQLIAAYFLCLALKNERQGRSLLDGVKEDVFLRDELYCSLQRCTSISEIVHETRHRLLQVD